MANFAKLTPIDMGVYRNKWSTGKDMSELFTAAATNGASSAKYGVYFEMPARDDKYVLIAYNSDATTDSPAHTAEALDITIHAGNGPFAHGKDLVLADLDPADYSFIKLDSGEFKCMENDSALATLANITSVKGCVVVEAENAKLKFCLLKMPF